MSDLIFKDRRKADRRNDSAGNGMIKCRRRPRERRQNPELHGADGSWWLQVSYAVAEGAGSK